MSPSSPAAGLGVEVASRLVGEQGLLPAGQSDRGEQFACTVPVVRTCAVAAEPLRTTKAGRAGGEALTKVT